jgi:hypothetical protein
MVCMLLFVVDVWARYANYSARSGDGDVAGAEAVFRSADRDKFLRHELATRLLVAYNQGAFLPSPSPCVTLLPVLLLRLSCLSRSLDCLAVCQVVAEPVSCKGRWWRWEPVMRSAVVCHSRRVIWLLTFVARVVSVCFLFLFVGAALN